jgi:transcriptional regulator with XRE-family HTH domain
MKKKRSSIGTLLRNTRRQLDLTLREVSRKSGVAIGQLSKLETDDCNPTLKTIKALSAIYKLEPTVWFES